MRKERMENPTTTGKIAGRRGQGFGTFSLGIILLCMRKITASGSPFYWYIAIVFFLLVSVGLILATNVLFPVAGEASPRPVVRFLLNFPALVILCIGISLLILLVIDFFD
ncbi:hypothetical protein HELRODRAFT_167114 [Helobdella robusta]|uniref:Uncharacterized protein n=1 Tax=Helobdella robusta TaxID=6412 RepID=T1EZ14_HELRO|nr:hypothetical protein HELRODRAFT_167114 [Helobdella robusta]ESO10608.1 hypothetical protein HELRODRAFT_167114 [Helobdella robusta]